MSDTHLPIIGVICATLQAEERPPRLGQNQTYLNALIRAGAAPVLIPPSLDQRYLRTLFDAVDGLLLPGGGDIDPARYGEPLHEKCGTPSLERDETELVLARWAVDEGKPLLAICRGIQVLNVALGGSLYQDIAAQVPAGQKHDWYPGYSRDHLAHPITLDPGARLAHILGTTSLSVNSLHHQALKKVAPGLRVAAWAPDQIIEAVEAEEHPFALGVQWHPEELANGDLRAQRLFDLLVENS